MSFRTKYEEKSFTLCIQPCKCKRFLSIVRNDKSDLVALLLYFHLFFQKLTGKTILYLAQTFGRAAEQDFTAT
ncbi:MAG: hypothetical protein JWQ85_1861 [Mucilaginibacter sp.]|nr:hypothetical protein [Mucilaginibacter sp.]